MKKFFGKTIAIMLAAACTLGVAACGTDDGGEDNGHDDPLTHYNIVFTLATIPPVLAALDCIESGYETYAMIERGNTYSGIEMTEGLKFHNLGFDIKSNTSAGFQEEQFEQTVDCIKGLNEKDNGYSFFHIYLRDADPMFGFALAANAELAEKQYELILCEDGSASYNSFKTIYADGKTVTAESDEPYETYLKNVADMKEMRDEVLSKTNNKLSDLKQGWEYGLAASALDNVVWRIQNKEQLLSILEQSAGESKLLDAMDGGENGCEIRSKSISDEVNSLSDANKKAYLSLMYGSYYEATYAALTRTTLSDGTAVPKKKLIFIGSRIKGSPALATDAAYGIGGAASAEEVPDSYADLAEKYKTPLLFGTEADYNLFLDMLADETNYPQEITDAQKAAVRVGCFNMYLNYLFTMKFTHAMYGADYDIIVKGHPSEVLGSSSTWTNHYEAEGYTYDLLMDRLVSAFHEKDSVGKFIGTVPYGTAAENLAYLGADISIGGLDSSTYKGYDQSVDVKFLLMPGDTDISANTNVGERYTEGNLGNHNADGSEAKTVYYNTGVIFKTLSAYYGKLGDEDTKLVYDGLLASWLEAKNASSVDDQGFVK